MKFDTQFSGFYVMIWTALATAIATTAAVQGQAGPPEHMVTFMTNAGQTECPDKWDEAGYAIGRLIIGTVNGADVGKTAGTPMTNAMLPEHVHGFEMSGTVGDVLRGTSPSGNNERGANGGVTATGTTDSHAANLPFVQFLVCEHKAAPSVDTMPYGGVAFFNAATCPEGWAAMDQASGRFLLPAAAATKLGYATEAVWDPATPPSHTHSMASSFQTGDAQYEAFDGANAELGFAVHERVDLTGTARAAGPVVPFVSLLTCERSEGIGHGEGVPRGSAMFFGGEICPDGWGLTVGSDGRFIVGIGGDGTQGATFGGDPINTGSVALEHNHAFSGDIGLKANAYPGSPPRQGFDKIGFVTTGAFGFAGTSGDETLEIPYLVMQSCTKN